MRRSYEAIGAADPSTTRIPSPEELFANWPDVQAKLSHATALLQLGLDDQPHVRCQPAVAFHGRLADWVADPDNPLFKPGGAPVVAHGRSGEIIEPLGATTMPQSVLPSPSHL